MNQINDEQRKRMVELFAKVKSSFDELPPYTIINRIMTIEGIDATRATRGYQLMRNLGVIPDRFVKGGKEVEEKVIKTFFTPVMCDLLTRFGCVIEEIKLLRKEPEQQALSFNSATSQEVAQVYQDIKVPAINSPHKLRDAIADKLLGLDTDF